MTRATTLKCDDRVYFGVYDCQRCGRIYTVNDHWKPCTPDFCHDCTEHLNKQYALLPDPEPMQ